MRLQDLKSLQTKEVVKLHHCASRKGYISASAKPYIEEYNGRFGRGYIVSYPNKDGLSRFFGANKSNGYYRIEYYIYK